MLDRRDLEPVFFAPFVSSLMKVEPAWIDYNGHLNMAYYNVLFDRAVDEVFELLGCGADYVKKGFSTFTAEVHVRYLRELKEGDPVRVTFQLLDYDSKRMHYFEQLFHAEEGWTLLPDSTVLTFDVKHAPNSEKYIPWLEKWVTAGSTIVDLHSPSEFGCLPYGKDNQLSYGFDLNGFNTDFIFRNLYGITLEQNENTTELGGYVTLRHKAGAVIIEPGLRTQYYASLGDFSLEPRLAVKANFSDHFRVKFAAGKYSQNLIPTVNEKDVVNLFVGFLSGPEERIYEPGTKTETKDKLQKNLDVAMIKPRCPI
jgi:acyl-CoA thioester hydrolase